MISKNRYLTFSFFFIVSGLVATPLVAKQTDCAKVAKDAYKKSLKKSQAGYERMVRVCGKLPKVTQNTCMAIPRKRYASRIERARKVSHKERRSCRKLNNAIRRCEQNAKDVRLKRKQPIAASYRGRIRDCIAKHNGHELVACKARATKWRNDTIGVIDREYKEQVAVCNRSDG